MRLFARRRKETEQVEIDLRGDEPVIRLGYPNNCPQCGHRGYLDHIDVENHTQAEHCTACGHRWSESIDSD